ncbi:hypothetical protein ABZ682_12750 [Streptomyces griseoviridis]|uniref:hypothetical protein n=1 Tax=Streptomyces griseoviridis TaxID=45398 RepID=UPI0033C02C7D
MKAQKELRLLPWAGPDGQPCYLSTSDPDSHMSRLADNIEAMQLGMSSQLREEEAQLLDDEATSLDPDALTLLAAQLAAALGEVLRVATSRGSRPVGPEPV